MNASEIDLDRRALMPIAVDTLCASALLTFDVYVQLNKSGRLMLYRERSYALTQHDLDVLGQRGIRTLYIRSGDAGIYRDHLRENVLKNKNIPPARRYQVLREAARVVLSESLENGDLGAAVSATRDIGQEMVDTVCNSQVMLNDLLRVMSHDYSTFTHAMNVSTYCLLIAWRLGIRAGQELVRIGQGGLLHDIGKLHVPRQILEKQGVLNEREKRIVMEHPSRGFRELSGRDDLDWGQLMMVYQHHERCDGRGYPAGVVRAEIHEHARIGAIADVCDALIRDRPYRKASPRSNVAEYLDRQAGRGFDEEMTQCWIAAIKSEA
jgi:HD-GYP domain-containing protein (c-di-GMP phosphodiesterase class II)